MAHQLQLEVAKYRQWVKAGRGLGYLKDGLAPFCQDIANQQHRDILDNIQRNKALSQNLTCACYLETLIPDHCNVFNAKCPYGEINCSCVPYDEYMHTCPNKICGAIYDSILQSHASTPPAPNLKNTNSQTWTSDPWSIAKCFIDAPGYDQKTSAADTDCTGLLHLVINNKYFHKHVTRIDSFSKVRSYRNKIFHSSNMELEETESNSYIDDMIAVLKDRKALRHQQYAQQAVQKLQDLKNKDFIITSESHEEVLRQVRENLMHNQKSTVSTKQKVEEVDRKILKIKELMKQTRDETGSTQELLKHTRDQMVKVSELINEKCEGNKYIETLLSGQEEIKKRLLVEKSPEQKPLEYEKAKAEWRNKIIHEYRYTLLKVPAVPLLPDETCEFSQIYVRPKIVSEEKDGKGETKETEIKSMSKIFTKDGDPLKSVYVVGDAGTGKSSFCKYLVNCWCKAHSEEQIVEDEFYGINEMKKFEFLFFISLRNNQCIDHIHNMLKNQYDIDILGKLLEKESTKMIVLLDGLDEWSSEGKINNQFQTIGLPIKDVHKDYTIVTTSRPWKIHTLRIRDTEIQQMLKLQGFDYKRESEFVIKTISNINFRKKDKRNIDQCKRKLREKSLRSLKQVPFMLQQLICLWFDDKLDKISKCIVYSEMLELFFTWNDDKTAVPNSENLKDSQNIELPVCLADKEMCELNSHLIYDMSRLAYETLLNFPKDKSLSFDISVFKKLKISDEVRESCLKLGLLTKDRCPSLSLSKRPKSILTFIHNSVQEFLAAVNITINFKTNMSGFCAFEPKNSMISIIHSCVLKLWATFNFFSYFTTNTYSSSYSENEDLQIKCMMYIKKVFKNCSTLNEILDQSNVIIMLCGLEPKLATHVSKYIYDIVKDHPQVQRYRRTRVSDIRFSSDYRCIRDIQKLIFDSIKECNTCLVENCPKFYIGDLAIYEWDRYSDIFCSIIDRKQIAPEFVHSIHIDNIDTKYMKFLMYLPNFKHLEKMQINYETLGLSSTENIDHIIDEVNNSVADTIKVNALTLKSLSLYTSNSDLRDSSLYKSPLSADDYTDKLKSLCKKVVLMLPNMNSIVAIRMTHMTMIHDDTTRLCDFLVGTSQLEQIYIDIKCDCKNKHDVDLSKHLQLRYLNLGVFMCVTDMYTVNLELFKSLNITNTNYIKIFHSIKKCDKMKELELSLCVNKESQTFHTIITERLVLVLPLLQNLCTLILYDLRLTDNIIQVPSEMKFLEHINLNFVIMSLTTWRKFVDSLPSIPHPVNVELTTYITEDGDEFNIDLTGDGEEFNIDMLLFRLRVRGGKENDAIQYVKNQKQLFDVKSDDPNLFEFSTRK